MVRGSLKSLVSKSLTVAGKWQHLQLRRLNIYEYQVAELMRKYGINAPKGVAVSFIDEVSKALKESFSGQDEVVIKSQVLAGGRGLGTFKNSLKGGVHIVKTYQVADISGKLLRQILVTKQTGALENPVNKLYLCEKMSLINEKYLAITLDHKTAGPLITACSKGGTRIEDLAEKYADMIIKVPIDVFEGITDKDAAKVVDGLALNAVDKTDAIEQVKKLYKLFCECDCTMLEINPLAETADKQLVAADAKVTFDDNAAFRPKEIFPLRDTTQEDPRELYFCKNMSLINKTYLAITLDRKTAGPLMTACSKGGTSIEDLAEKYPDMIIKDTAAKVDLNHIGFDGDIGCMVNGGLDWLWPQWISLSYTEEPLRTFCMLVAALLKTRRCYGFPISPTNCLSMLALLTSAHILRRSPSTCGHCLIHAFC